MHSRYVKITQSMSFDSTGKKTERLPLPKGRIESISLRADYTVTDAGISAGEDFAGVITNLIIGDEQAPLVDVKQDEIETVIDLMVDGISTGFYADATPTTEVAQHAYFTIPGPYQLADYHKPELILELNPVGEFAGASAFVATVYVDVVMSKPKDQHKPGARVYRQTSGSAQTHAIPIGPGIVKDMIVITGTGGNLSEVRLATEAERGGKSDSEFDVKTNYPRAFVDELARLKRTTVDTTKYFVPGLESYPYAGRELEVDMSSAATLKVFARNVVGGY